MRVSVLYVFYTVFASNATTAHMVCVPMCVSVLYVFNTVCARDTTAAHMVSVPMCYVCPGDISQVGPLNQTHRQTLLWLVV